MMILYASESFDHWQCDRRQSDARIREVAFQSPVQIPLPPMERSGVGCSS